ncbi:transposase [Streptomyces sp. A73]|nr:transposase [Streptomyces sp. A73]
MSAAILFVATSGCSWRQAPEAFGPSWPTVYRCFTEGRAGLGCGSCSTARYWTSWARVAIWTGRGARSTR